MRATDQNGKWDRDQRRETENSGDTETRKRGKDERPRQREVFLNHQQKRHKEMKSETHRDIRKDREH